MILDLLYANIDLLIKHNIDVAQSHKCGTPSEDRTHYAVIFHFCNE